MTDPAHEVQLARERAVVRLWDELTAAGNDPRLVAEAAAGAVQAVLGGGVALYLVDVADPHVLELAAVRHDDEGVVAEVRSLAAFSTREMDPQGYLAQAVRARRPLLFDTPWKGSREALAEYLPRLVEHLPTTLLLAPLLRGDRVLGVLVAARHETGATFDAAQVDFVEQVAARVALATANAQLAAAEQEAARRQHAVDAVSRSCEEVLSQPDRLLDVAARSVAEQVGTGCLLWLVDDVDAEHLGRVGVWYGDPQAADLLRAYLSGIVPVPGALLARVLRTGSELVDGRDALAQALVHRPEVQGMLAQFPETTLYSVRLDARGRPVAILSVAGVEPFVLEDRRLVDAVAERLALSLDNARLLAATRASRKRHRALVQHSSDMLMLADRDGVIRYASPAARRLAPGRAIDSIVELVAEEDRDVAELTWQRVLQEPGQARPVELRYRDPAGKLRRLSVVANNLVDDPAVEGVVVTARDVTDERDAARRLAERAAQQAALARISRAALTAPVGELQRVVAGAVHSTLDVPGVGVLRRGSPREWTVVASTDPAHAEGAVLSAPWAAGLERLTGNGEVVIEDDRRQDEHDGGAGGDGNHGGPIDEPGVLTRALAAVVVHGRVWGALVASSRQVRRFTPVERDFLQTAATVLAGAIERDGIAARLLDQATHDALTGLPNRAQLHDHLLTALDEARGSGDAVALLLLDLDDFKDVNDSLGHGVGDQVLAQLGARLERVLDGAPLVARLGGDEFAVCLDGNDVRARAEATARRVLAELRTPFRLPGIDVTLSASIGIAVGPEQGRRPHELLQAADMAMYRAKEERSGWTVYDDGLDRGRSERLEFLADLRTALAGDELELHYQPLVDLRTERVVEVEALVRWRHPTRGLLPPDAFVPLAEQTDLVHELTDYVVRRAVKQASAWREAGWAGSVAVNVSAVGLRQPAVVDALRTELLAGEGTLSVEITESALVDERAHRAVRVFADSGIQCSVDDFGTGYSALTYLRTLPVRRLKLDRAFNRRVDREPRDASIVGGVVDLAHSIGLDVVAEGVETRAVADRLRALGVDVAQGWLYGRPEPASLLRLDAT